MSGTIIVNLALIFYSIGIITEQRKKVISKNVLKYLTIGVTADIIATSLMIAGSKNSPFTPHGILGYTSLAAMLLDTILVWRLKNLNKINCSVPKSLHLYSRFAYVWWLLAYTTGVLIIIFKYHK